MAQGSNPSLSAIFTCNSLIYKYIIFTDPSMGPSWDHPTRNHHPHRTQCVQRSLNHRLSSGADMLPEHCILDSSFIRQLHRGKIQALAMRNPARWPDFRVGGRCPSSVTVCSVSFTPVAATVVSAAGVHAFGAIGFALFHAAASTLPTCLGDIPTAYRDLTNRSMDTEGSPDSILATRD